MHKRVGLIVGAMVGGLVAVLGLVPSASADSNSSPASTYVGPGVNPANPVVKDGKGIESCGPYAAFGPVGGSWSGAYSWVGCSYWGTTYGSVKNYWWYIQPFSESQGCAQGYGFTLGTHTPIWRSVGCGDGTSANVPWGEVVGIPKFKAKSISFPLGAPRGWI